MSKKALFYTAFFVVLALGFYFVMRAMIPEFGSIRNTSRPIKPFAFTNQDGNQVTDQDVRGKVFAVEYFFTTCKGICPRMNKNMAKVYERFRNEPDFLILSHTSDPGTDSPEKLKQYADSMGVATSRWVFLTGRKDSLYKMARLSYDIDDKANNVVNIEDEFLHTQFFTLVTKEGRVLNKKYDGLKESEIKEMMDDIEKLLKE